MPFLAPLIGVAISAVAGVASWLAGGGILAGIAKIGLALAAQYLLAGSNKPEAQATQLETVYGEDLARSVAMGYVGTAGHLVYRNAYGDGNRSIQDVYVVSHFLASQITRFEFKGVWATLEADVDTGKGHHVGGINGNVYVKFYDGQMDQTADAQLIAQANPVGRWTTDHRLAGMSYIVVTWFLDREHMSSPPELFVELKGAPLYDFRKDSSVGGSGTHRWDDQSTWEFSENPVLQAYLLERGVFRGTEMICGKGTPANRLPLAEWTLAANICDELIEGKPRYKSGVIAASGEGITHDQNLQPLLSAMCASWCEDATGEYPIVGAEQASVATFTDLDLVSTESRRFSKFRTRSELVNTVAGKYVDPESFYALVPFTPKVSDAALIEDGERLAVAISFGAINSLECADRVSNIQILASRYQASAEIVLRPKFLKLKPGQWVTWDSDLYGERVFQILTKRLGPLGPTGTRDVYLSLQEVSEHIFDGTEYVTVPSTPTLPGAPSYATQADGMIAQGVQMQVAGSQERIPGIRCQWNAFTDPTVIALDIEYRPAADVVTITIANPGVINWASHGLSVDDPFFLATTGALPTGLAAGTLYYVQSVVSPNAITAAETIGGPAIVTTGMQSGVQTAYQNSIVKRATVPAQVLIATDGVLANSVYEYRSRPITSPFRTTFFSPWAQVNTPAAVVVGVSVELAQVGQDTRDILKRINLSLQDAYARIEQIAIAGAQGAQTIVKQDSVAVADRNANAAAFTSMEASITELGDDLVAQAVLLAGVTASVDNLTAGGLWRMRAQAGVGEVVAEIVLEVRANIGDAFTSASTIWQAGFTGSPPVAFSRFVVQADDFIVTDGTNTGTPLVFSGSQLKLQVARIGLAIVEELQSANAKLVIKGNGTDASIELFA